MVAMRTLRSTVVCMAMVAVACSSTGSDRPVQPNPPAVAEPPVDGGTLVLRLAAEPGCFDWFGPCGSGAGPLRTLLLPHAVAFVDGRYAPTPVLASEPVQDKGPPHRLTYRIDPRAAWSDGVPITSSDFRYTWDQAVNATGIANRTGFEQIENVDDTDPKTAVVTFKQPYAGWYNPFGTLQGIFPKHLLEGKDRTAEMKDGYTWSGGPWKLDRWTKGQEIRLIPNPAYWGKKPHLDALVFRVIPDSGAALAAYKTGQVSVIQGVPPEVTLAELESLADTTVETTVTLNVNGLLFNTERAPLDAVPVRQALAHATDRDALVQQAFGLLKPDLKPVQAMMTPANGRWYLEPFARYKPDLARVDQLMRGAGWARGSDGIWVKSGQRAEIEVVGPAGNKGVELQDQILQSQWKEAGFEAKITNVANPLDLMRRGAFHVAFSTQSYPSDDPSRCSLLCSRNTPSPANGLSGQNMSRINDPAHDAAWDRVNNEVDEAKRLEALKAAYQITAELVPVLPTAPGLSLLVYNNSHLRGIRNDAGPNGPFHGTTDWFCRGGTC